MTQLIESTWKNDSQTTKEVKVKVLVTQSWPTLCNSVDCSPPGSSVHGILQVRILEWVAIPFSRGSSHPRDQTQVPCIAGRFLTIWANKKALQNFHMIQQSHSWIYTQSKPSFEKIHALYVHCSVINNNHDMVRGSAHHEWFSPRNQQYRGWWALHVSKGFCTRLCTVS